MTIIAITFRLIFEITFNNQQFHVMQIYRIKNINDFIKLRKLSKVLLCVLDLIILKPSPLMGALISIIPFIIALNCSLIQLIVFIILWSCAFSYVTYFVLRIMSYQIAYFAVLCYYLRLKLQHENNKMRSILAKRNNTNNKTFGIISTLYAIYDQIYEYNKIYWSKFLFVFCSLMSCIIADLIFEILFAVYHNILITVAYLFSTFAMQTHLQHYYFIINSHE